MSLVEPAPLPFKHRHPRHGPELRFPPGQSPAIDPAKAPGSSTWQRLPRTYSNGQYLKLIRCHTTNRNISDVVANETWTVMMCCRPLSSLLNPEGKEDPRRYRYSLITSFLEDNFGEMLPRKRMYY